MSLVEDWWLGLCQLGLESIHASFDELNVKLIVYCECMCMFDGEGGQALEKDRGKQPETSNQ